ncbi:FCD domain-containing protein [Streptomyces sp. IB2014 016-6]|nr:FCD domain-containing protein [Streptomyces sp. IB2014 016-6]TXL87867.1 FCD domain-containing protein [Streptomyces sp. IB2014 016-6]
MDRQVGPGVRVGIEPVARTLEASPTPVREAPARPVLRRARHRTPTRRRPGRPAGRSLPHIFRLSGVPGAGPPTLAEHERIPHAIPRRNPDRAAEAMTEHLRRGLERRRGRRSPNP